MYNFFPGSDVESKHRVRDDMRDLGRDAGDTKSRALAHKSAVLTIANQGSIFSGISSGYKPSSQYLTGVPGPLRLKESAHDFAIYN